MSTQFTKTKFSKSKLKDGKKGLPWLWIALSGVAVLVLAYFAWQYINQPRFVFLDGNEELLVLIRTDEQGVYRVQYQGRQPVALRSLVVMLEGQILHIDVGDVTLQLGEESFLLASDGTLPPGSEIILKPADTFDVQIVFHGQTIGGNYLYGFRIEYERGARQRTYEVTADQRYTLIVR